MLRDAKKKKACAELKHRLGGNMMFVYYFRKTIWL